MIIRSGTIVVGLRWHSYISCHQGSLPEDRSLYLHIAGLALKHPRLIPHLVRAAWAFRARDWYRRPPFLPLPPRSYMRWRMETAYGDPDARPSAGELLRYLSWGTRMRAAMKRRIRA